MKLFFLIMTTHKLSHTSYLTKYMIIMNRCLDNVDYNINKLLMQFLPAVDCTVSHQSYLHYNQCTGLVTQLEWENVQDNKYHSL